jgi:hypothetical protein
MNIDDKKSRYMAMAEKYEREIEEIFESGYYDKVIARKAPELNNDGDDEQDDFIEVEAVVTDVEEEDMIRLR